MFFPTLTDLADDPVEHVARRAIDRTMTAFGCYSTGPWADEKHGRNEAWTAVVDGSETGLLVTYGAAGICDAVDLNTGGLIASGKGLAGIAKAVVTFYLEAPLDEVRAILLVGGM